MKYLFRYILMGLFVMASALSMAQEKTTTYCNPLNLDYTYMIYNSAENLSYRSGADPAVVSDRALVVLQTRISIK